MRQLLYISKLVVCVAIIYSPVRLDLGAEIVKLQKNFDFKPMFHLAPNLLYVGDTTTMSRLLAGSDIVMVEFSEAGDEEVVADNS